MDTSKISQHNLNVFEEYIEGNRDRNRSEHTIVTQHMYILPFLNFIDEINVEDLKPADVKAYFRHLRKYRYTKGKSGELKEYSENTKYTQRSFVKKFLSILNPEAANEIELDPVKNNKLPEDLLTKEEIEKLIMACRTARDRALIATLYETGCRRGELLSIRIKNVDFESVRGAVIIYLRGKTGERRNKLVYARSYLREWIDVHPKKDDREAFLFCSNREPFPTISNTGLAGQLQKVAKRAGIQKKIYPHIFRHSRATHLAQYFTEQEMKKFMGWATASKMTATYIHLSGRDIDLSVDRMYGVVTEDTEIENKLKPVKCPNCKQPSSTPGAVFCSVCGAPLTEKVRYKNEKDESDASKLVLEIIAQHPEFLGELMKRLNSKKEL